jgi:hypothetical protein
MQELTANHCERAARHLLLFPYMVRTEWEGSSAALLRAICGKTIPIETRWYFDVESDGIYRHTSTDAHSHFLALDDEWQVAAEPFHDLVRNLANAIFPTYVPPRDGSLVSNFLVLRQSAERAALEDVVQVALAVKTRIGYVLAEQRLFGLAFAARAGSAHAINGSDLASGLPAPLWYLRAAIEYIVAAEGFQSSEQIEFVPTPQSSGHLLIGGVPVEKLITRAFELPPPNDWGLECTLHLLRMLLV